MGRLSGIALEEELEVDKLHDRELAARKSGEYDVQYNELKENNKAKEETKEEEGTEEVPEGETDVQETDALESIKELAYSPETFSSVIYSLADMTTTLGVLGIQYGSSIARHVFKGVVYLFTKVARLLYTSTVMLNKYLERRSGAFNNVKKSIGQLRSSLKEIKENNDISDQKFTIQQTINMLKVGDRVNFTDNINQLTSVIESTIKAVTSQIINETAAINHIMSAGKTGFGKLPTDVMKIRPDQLGLTEGAIQGYQPASEYVIPYRNRFNLPGDVALIGMFPNSDMDELLDITKGYNDSALILGFDTTSFIETEAVDYMNSEDLGTFLDSLEKLCDTCIAHEAMYEKIKHSKLYIKSYFKNYFTALVHKDKKVSVKDSFMEQIYLKSMFIDKVYLSFMINFHDYASRVLVAGTRYVKENIDQLV